MSFVNRFSIGKEGIEIEATQTRCDRAGSSHAA